MFNIRLENFEGPLDLLLYFIKRDKIDIYDIPITEITIEYIQVIDDAKGITLASASTIEKDLVKAKSVKKELAELVGKKIAERSIAKGIKDVAFDKGRYKYHGLIKILAESARSEGLNF